MSWWETKEAKPLSLEGVKKGIEILNSHEYRQRELEKMATKAAAHDFIDKKYKEGKITQIEYLHLWNNIEVNGILVVSPTMGEKLK